MYSKCGYLEESIKICYHVMQNMEKEKKELNYLKKMIRADQVTFICILTGCSHSGLLKEANHYFKEMTEKFNIKPNIDHYNCMIDLLSHTCNGKFDEAENYIKSIKIRN